MSIAGVVYIQLHSILLYNFTMLKRNIVPTTVGVFWVRFTPKTIGVNAYDMEDFAQSYVIPHAVVTYFSDFDFHSVPFQRPSGKSIIGSSTGIESITNPVPINGRFRFTLL